MQMEICRCSDNRHSKIYVIGERIRALFVFEWPTLRKARELTWFELSARRNTLCLRAKEIKSYKLKNTNTMQIGPGSIQKP